MTLMSSLKFISVQNNSNNKRIQIKNNLSIFVTRDKLLMVFSFGSVFVCKDL